MKVEFQYVHSLMSSYAGDIWSENRIAIFAIMVHFIDFDWKLNTRLALCKGLDKIAHTSDIIDNITCNRVV